MPTCVLNPSYLLKLRFVFFIKYLKTQKEWGFELDGNLNLGLGICALVLGGLVEFVGSELMRVG